MEPLLKGIFSWNFYSLAWSCRRAMTRQQHCRVLKKVVPACMMSALGIRKCTHKPRDCHGMDLEFEGMQESIKIFWWSQLACSLQASAPFMHSEQPQCCCP